MGVAGWDAVGEFSDSAEAGGVNGGHIAEAENHNGRKGVEGIEDVQLELTFDPPWTPDKMSDDAKFILGFG